MNSLKKPAVALILCAAVVIASSLISVRLKLGSECDEVISGFHDGVYVDGVLMPSIASQLLTIRGCADEISYIAKAYAVDTEELGWAADDIRNGLIYSEADASYLYYCYEEILDELREVEDKLRQAAVSDKDRELLNGYFEEIRVARELIDISGYNASVRQFSKNKLHFPAEFLGELAGVEFPELFS